MSWLTKLSFVLLEAMKYSVHRPIEFVALVLTAVALIPTGAHFFEMNAKMKLAQDAYFQAQSLYRGWNLFGFVFMGTLAACLASAIVAPKRSERRTSLFAAVMIALSLTVFFTVVYPANQITQSWTAIPANWEGWRLRWEWGHSGEAICVFLAFLALAWSAVMTKDWRR